MQAALAVTRAREYWRVINGARSALADPRISSARVTAGAAGPRRSARVTASALRAQRTGHAAVADVPQ